MSRIEILVEEKSMEELLSLFLPTILPNTWHLGHNYFIRSHEGKNDLQKSIPKKVRVFSNWHEPLGVIIIHDQDSDDCKKLKARLIDLCKNNGNCPHLIRIVCRELESWYIGDFYAIKSAYPNFKAENYSKKAKYRNPDICNASYELNKLLPEFQKVGSAKKIAPFLNVNTNKSNSFKQTVLGILNFFSKFEKN